MAINAFGAPLNPLPDNPADSAIQALVDQWFESDEADVGRSLPDWLGMTPELYGRWSSVGLSGIELQEWADRRGLKLDEEEQ